MGKVVSLSDIAEALGVSKMSVSIALRGKYGVSAPLRASVLKCAKKMGYSRDAEVCRTMSEIKRRGSGKFCGTIALMLAVESEDVLRNHPTFPEFLNGIMRGAKQLGYNVDKFFLYENGSSAEKFARIFRSRGIKGGVLAGIYDNSYLPTKFQPLWKEFKFVSAGVRTYNPHLDYASSDQFLVTRNAVIELLKLGYSRPALVLDQVINNIVDDRFTGGFLAGQMRVIQKNRVPPFLHSNDNIKNETDFKKWFLRYRPDSILCLYNTPKSWLESMGVKIPKDVALVQLERRNNNPEWSGMDQHNDSVGELCVRRLADFLNSPLSEKSLPTAIFVPPDWCNASTAERKRSKKKI